MMLKPCPKCGSKPQLKAVGDRKEYLIYECPNCAYTPLRWWDARITERNAREMWNRMVGDTK